MSHDVLWWYQGPSHHHFCDIRVLVGESDWCCEWMYALKMTAANVQTNHLWSSEPGMPSLGGVMPKIPYCHQIASTIICVLHFLLCQPPHFWSCLLQVLIMDYTNMTKLNVINLPSFGAPFWLELFAFAFGSFGYLSNVHYTKPLVWKHGLSSLHLYAFLLTWPHLQNKSWSCLLSVRLRLPANRSVGARVCT